MCGKCAHVCLWMEKPSAIFLFLLTCQHWDYGFSMRYVLHHTPFWGFCLLWALAHGGDHGTFLLGCSPLQVHAATGVAYSSRRLWTTHHSNDHIHSRPLPQIFSTFWLPNLSFRTSLSCTLPLQSSKFGEEQTHFEVIIWKNSWQSCKQGLHSQINPLLLPVFKKPGHRIPLAIAVVILRR